MRLALGFWRHEILGLHIWRINWATGLWCLIGPAQQSAWSAQTLPTPFAMDASTGTNSKVGTKTLGGAQQTDRRTYNERGHHVHVV